LNPKFYASITQNYCFYFNFFDPIDRGHPIIQRGDTCQHVHILWMPFPYELSHWGQGQAPVYLLLSFSLLTCLHESLSPLFTRGLTPRIVPRRRGTPSPPNQFDHSVQIRPEFAVLFPASQGRACLSFRTGRIPYRDRRRSRLGNGHWRPQS